MANRPYARRWIDAAGAGVLGAFVVATLEILFVAAMVPAALSSPLGVLFAWAQTFALFGGYALVGVSIVAVPGRAHVRRALARAGGTFALAAAIALLALVPLLALIAFVGDELWEFPREMRAMHACLALASVFAVVAAGLALRARLEAWLVARVAWRVRRFFAAAIVALGAALGVACAHLFVGPESLVAACGVVGAVVLALAVVAAACVAPRARRPRDALVVLALPIASLAFFVPGAARDHGRFLLWNHGAMAAPLAEVVRDALDRDHDGSSPVWLGGTDCAEGDPKRGPLLREIPGDGVDQDCRGGDAPVPSPPPAARLPAACSAPASRPSILFVSVDALRADRVTPETMPVVFALARRGTVFTRAYSPTGLTGTSMTATMTARPFADLVTNALKDELLQAGFSVASKLESAGYRTRVFNPFGMHALLLHGFEGANDAWFDRPPIGPKEILTSGGLARAALDFMSAPGAPFFAWVHFGDAHARYKLDHDDDGHARSESEAYDAGVTYVGEALARLITALDERGLLEHTVVVITADHGEELMARGREGHGPDLFEESIHVPLVLLVPGCAPRVVDTPVGLAQIGPTLGALAGARIPGWGLFDDRPLPVVSEATVSYRTQFKRAVVGERYKLLVDVANGGRMLFDLTADPGETTNLYADAPDARGLMEAAYQRWLDAPGAR